MITFHQVTKRYNSLTAVNNFSLSIAEKEVFGLLGPNGAGKTTLIRILTTLTRPDSGSVLLQGQDMSRELVKAKGQIGVVLQHINLDGELTVWENLELHGRLHKVPTGKRKERIAALLDFCELTERAGERAAVLSGGLKRRLMLARALLHRPSVLLLDEPTVGLDPQARRNIWDLVRKLNYQGLTVFLTTHYIEEAEALCSRVGLINRGELIALGTPGELKENIGKIAVEHLYNGKNSYHFFSNREEATPFVEQMTGKVTIRAVNLEDVFMQLTNRKVGEH